MMFKSLDHLAVVVPNTEAALLIWRDKFGLPVLFTETINNGTLRLTHLDLGNTQLQLVEPLASDHPLAAWLAARRCPSTTWPPASPSRTRAPAANAPCFSIGLARRTCRLSSPAPKSRPPPPPAERLGGAHQCGPLRFTRNTNASGR